MAVKDAFLAGILAQLPEADRGKAEAAIEGLEAGHLRQDEFSREMNRIKTVETAANDLLQQNTDWFTNQQANLQELERLRGEIKTGVLVKAGGTGVPPAGGDTFSKADVTKLLTDTIAETERGAVGFITELSGLSMTHFKEFGEVLDTNALLADKRVQQLGLRGVYNDLHKDQLAAKATAAQTARDDKIRQEARTALLTEQAASHRPYPITGNEASTLDGIEPGKTPTEAKSVDQLAQEFARLGAARAVGAH